MEQKARSPEKGKKTGAERFNEDLLVEALASGLSREEAAAVAGTSERTVRRRLENDRFRHRVLEVQRKNAAEFASDLHRGRRTAFRVVMAIATDQEAAASARLRAAGLLWAMHADVNQVDLEARVAELEASKDAVVRGGVDWTG